MQAREMQPSPQPTFRQLLGSFRSPSKRLRYERDHAARSPSWRFDLASELVGSDRRAPSKQADAMLAAVFDFLRRYGRKRDDADLEAIGLLHPDLTRAFDLYLRGGLKRSELEARILARQIDAEIAAAMRIPPGTVAAYEAAFFNVRDRLGHPYYILLQAIPNHVDKLIDGDAATVLKLFGYFVGPVALDVMLKHAMDEAGQLRPPQLASLKTEDERLAARAQTAAAAMAGTADPKRMIELLAVQQMIQEADRLAASAKDSLGAGTEGVYDRGVDLVGSELNAAWEADMANDDPCMPSESGHLGADSHEAA
jgi:hypothetical protein